MESNGGKAGIGRGLKKAKESKRKQKSLTESEKGPKIIMNISS